MTVRCTDKTLEEFHTVYPFGSQQWEWFGDTAIEIQSLACRQAQEAFQLSAHFPSFICITNSRELIIISPELLPRIILCQPISMNVLSSCGVSDRCHVRSQWWMSLVLLMFMASKFDSPCDTVIQSNCVSSLIKLLYFWSMPIISGVFLEFLGFKACSFDFQVTDALFTFNGYFNKTCCSMITTSNFCQPLCIKEINRNLAKND